MGANAVFSARTSTSLRLGHSMLCTLVEPFYAGVRRTRRGAVLAAAKEQGAITTMDVLGVQKDGMADILRPCMPHLDYFMPNIEEAEMVSGLPLAATPLDSSSTWARQPSS